MKRIISLIAALALIFCFAVPGCAEPNENESVLLAVGADENVSDDTTETVAEDPVTVVNDSYVFEHDPEGIDGGSNIDFTRDNYVADFANVFSESEKDTLFEKISFIRNTYKFDVVVLTTLSTNGKTAEAYTDDFFDYNGYGYGASRDGVIIMLCLAGGEGNRDVHISGRGPVGKSVFNSNYVLDFDDGPIFKEILPFLSDGEYYNAELRFLEEAEMRLRWNAEDSSNGDNDTDDGNGTNYYPAAYIIRGEIAAVVTGCVVAFIVVFILKRKMKTNRIQTHAANYEKPGSMQVTASYEHFVRKDVTRTAIPKDTDSGGDHTSSSGASHSGGGGKF